MDRVLKGEELVDPPLSRFDIVYVPRSSVGNLSVFLQAVLRADRCAIMDTA